MVARKIAEKDAMSARRADERARSGNIAPPAAKMRRIPAAVRRGGASANTDAYAEQRPTNVVQAIRRDAPTRGDTDEKMRERHEQRKGWFLQEASRQAFNRARMARCESFYDSEQWASDDADALRDRGQNPVVYNEIKPTIDWLIGTERRTRIDFSVLAEGEDDADSEDAANKQKLLKFLDDTNKAQFERSWASEDAFKAGIGWIEVGARGDKSDVPVFVGAVSWRDILWDSMATRRDLADARYIFRIKVVDEDVARACFPDKAEEIDRVVQTGDNLTVFSEFMGGIGLINGLDQFSAMSDPLDTTARPVDLFNVRKRVLLLECWSREPVPRKPTADGLGDPVEFKIRVSIMTEHDTLVEAWSPFKHDRFPFIPVWAYRSRRTGLPYSPIWPLLGPQEALNHRMSKSLFEASANQWEMEATAFDASYMDLEELREEYNAPDGIPVLAAGALQNNRVRKIDNMGKAEQQLKLAEIDQQVIRSMSGVTGENRAEETNAKSGKAIIAKQQQGSLLTMELFDNLLLSRQLEGEQTLSLSEQFIVNPMTIRNAGDGGKVDRTKINQPMRDEATGEIVWHNDITARRAHFVVGEQPWKQSYAEAAYESLLEVLTQLATAAPQVVVNLLDVVFDMNPNLPRKRQVIERMRKINGQTDPDGKLTPEQAAEQQKAQQVAQMQFQAAMEQLQADIAKAQAQGASFRSDAVLKSLQAVEQAATAALILVQSPQTAPVADELLRSSGFVDHDASSSAVIDNTGSGVPAQMAAPLSGAGAEDGADAGQPAPMMGAM